MAFSTVDVLGSNATVVTISEHTLSVELWDGRAISVPLSWYPRLVYGTEVERQNWQLIAGGEAIHWPDLDEDISIGSLLAGKASAESQSSLDNWLSNRAGRRASP